MTLYWSLEYLQQIKKQLRTNKKYVLFKFSKGPPVVKYTRSSSIFILKNLFIILKHLHWDTIV